MKRSVCRLLLVCLFLCSAMAVSARSASADTRQDAQTLVAKLRKAGVEKKMADEMKSMETAFATAEKAYKKKDQDAAERYYLLALQKGKVIEATINKQKKTEADPVQPVPVAVSGPELAPIPIAAPAPASVAPPVVAAKPASLPERTAIDVSVDATTLFNFQRRDITGTGSEKLYPATQFLGVDLDKLADGNLSLHFYGWGRADLADNSYNDRKVDGSLTYGYLQYRFKEANADLRIGRVFVREGIAYEQLDGLSARTDLPAGFTLSAFGGATVHNRKLFGETSDGKGNTVAGGRASYRYKGVFELGASGVYESNAPALINYTNGNHRLLGGDLWLAPVKQVELMGHTSYNPETKGIAEHTYLLNIKPVEHLTISTEFNEHHEKNYLYAWSMFSGAALNSDDKSRSVGGKVSYELAKPVELSADYKHYVRETTGAKPDADRYGADLRLKFLDNSVRSGIAYHYLRAGKEFAIGSTPSASYHELRSYAMHDTKGYFASVDLLGFLFKDKIYNEKSAWEGIGSIGYHLTPALALSGDVSYGRNPQFTEEVRGLVRLTYNMLYSGKGGKQ